MEEKKTKFCINCGAEIPVSSKYCDHCGTRQPDVSEINTESEQTEIKEEPVIENKPKTGTTILLIVVVLVAFAVGFFGWTYFSNNSSDNNKPKISETAKTDKQKEKAVSTPEATETPIPKAATTPEPAATPVPQETLDTSYLLPDSATRKITADDLAGMSAKDLTYARNEIYARHGKVFVHNELNRYFQTKSWYHADPSFTDDMVSDLEGANAGFILQYQKDNGLLYDPGE